jgi:PPOX class probable F420-dependent enzyme
MSKKGNNNKDNAVEFVDSPPQDSGFYDSMTETNDEEASTPSKEDVAKLFEGRNLVFVSTLSKDGSPHVTPVWADIQNDLILINTSEAAAKNKHVIRDPRIAISIVEHYNPYNMVSITGRVVERSTDGADEHLKKLAKKYLGIGKYYYRHPKNRRVILKIKPEKIMGLSLHPAFYFLAYSPWYSPKRYLENKKP